MLCFFYEAKTSLFLIVNPAFFLREMSYAELFYQRRQISLIMLEAAWTQLFKKDCYSRQIGVWVLFDYLSNDKIIRG
jgi:hypothetical protein